MKKIFVALMIVAGFSTQAHAWGDREQGALAGIAATLILQEITRNSAQQQVQTMPPVISHRGTYHPVIVAPNIDPRVYRPQMQPPVQYMCPVFDQYGRLMGHQWCR